MSKMTLLDKLKILYEVSKSSLWFLIIIFILFIISIILLKTNKKNISRNKIIYIGFISIIISLITFNYYESLNNIFDYMMNNLFIAIYFPNLAIYFAAIITINIIVWISIFNFKTSEIIRKLNIIIYMIINYLLFLILNVIDVEKLDVFTRESIYKNNKATALIELSSVIFVVWIIFLILYKIILIYIRKDYKPNTKIKKVIVKEQVKIKKLPENYEPTSVPKKIYGNIKNNNKTKGLEIKNYQPINIPDLIYGNIKKKPIVENNEEQQKKIYEDILTLNDYKQLLELLKTKKKKEKNEKPKTQNFEKTTIEILKKREKEKEQANLTELENLYRSIR